MSIVIGLKTQKGIIMAADSQVTSGQLKIPENPQTPKCVNTASGIIVGTVGSLLNHTQLVALPIFHAIFKAPKLTKAIMIEQIVNPWFHAMRSLEEDISDQLHKSHSRALFAHQDHLFYVDYRGGIYQIDHYIAIGSGSDAAFPHLSDTHLSDSKRINGALEAAAYFDAMVSGPFIIQPTFEGAIE